MKKHKEKIYEYEVVFDPNGDGYTVTVPKLPGLVTEGNTLKEARAMAKDAIRCYLGSLLKDTLISVSKKSKRAEVNHRASRSDGGRVYWAAIKNPVMLQKKHHRLG